MKQAYLTLSMLAVFGSCAFAQSIEPQVIGSTGDHYTSAGAQLSFTAGEVMIETVTATNSIITQGFHQPESSGVGISENTGKIQMNVFPNPTFDQVTIALKQHDQNFNVALFDAQGKLVIQDQILKNTNNQTMDMSRLAAGTYILRVTSHDTKHAATFNIQKMK